MMSAFPTRLIAKRIESASVDRFRSNAGVGKQGFEWVLQRGLELAQGITGEFGRNGGDGCGCRGDTPWRTDAHMRDGALFSC